MTTLEITCPDDIFSLLGYPKESLQHMAQEALFVRLYDEGMLSSYQVARALNITRDEFLQILPRYRVAAKDVATELSTEIQRQTELHQPQTPLVKKLVESRARIIVSGEQMLDWDEVQQEVANRRVGIEA